MPGACGVSCGARCEASASRGFSRGLDGTGAVAQRRSREENGIMIAMRAALRGASLAALLAAGTAPALAQDQPGNIERVETPQGTVTIVRPTPRAQSATPAPQVNPDPV